ncbi:amino acid ABC transporter permease [Brevibacterium moorei]|uniref:amino acid ABC transporter permease n=1 Tax=Brevibacterium moorei TaxID=2968457 RepID=UPI00211C0805|nr:amino acid ABC transporter permease [Brevibacterium sp. 68QC2CO]
MVIALIAAFIHLLMTNRNLKWNVVGEYLFNGEILHGLWVTIELTVLAMIIGLALGIVLAIMRLSRNPLFSSVAWIWIWFFRGVPPLVQMIFWFNLATLIPVLKLGIPYTGIAWAQWDMNQVMTSFAAAILGLAFTESAYAAEMIRAGIMAVPHGQVEAASALGIRSSKIMRTIILPQALRIVIPPIGNDLISMLKFTSLVSVLATPDLLYSAQMIYSRTYQTIPLLLVATVWYLVLTTIFTIAQQLIERRIHDQPMLNVRRLRFNPFASKGPKKVMA